MYDGVSGLSWPRGGNEVVFIQIKVLKESYFGRKGSRHGPFKGYLEQAVVASVLSLDLQYLVDFDV